jgi:S1-C subfamily serine protease
VVPQPLSPDRAKQLNVPEGKGVVIGLLLPASPAEKAGLKVGDVITAIDGKPVADPSGLRNRTFTLEAGTEVPVTFIRSGIERTVPVAIAEMPPDKVIAYFGFSVKDGPVESRGGVVVDLVVPGTPAAKSGLTPGLRIIGIGQRRFVSKAEFDNLINSLVGSPEIPLVVLRDGNPEFLPLVNSAADRP